MIPFFVFQKSKIDFQWTPGVYKIKYFPQKSIIKQLYYIFINSCNIFCFFK